jgi:hypothetical protein
VKEVENRMPLYGMHARLESTAIRLSLNKRIE